MPLKAVFDTNVLFSAVAWSGPPSRCVDLARRGGVEGLTCEEILQELAEKLESRLGFSKADADDAVADLLGFLSVVSIPDRLHGVSRDPDDDKVLECALTAGARYIVTGDKDLLVLREYRGIAIVRPAEFHKVATS